ncbi:hypothetical protein L9F63_002832 [Diploptera punctata]|uniref:mRNA-decapping enzyme C-terminal domain-containing protein n=1 Tax=Diploptera punctata TaxID=6984 RepID=A0AAD8ED33_DIPPU|nr:hypothetical protein L9F63_002832 [Diploptera punctata]
MADVTELRMNVAALSRVDPYAKDIIETATHVALYTFNADGNEWEKTDVEGALFVYSRNGDPFHSILIMNRLNTQNLVEPVTQGLDLQVQEPFLLYRNTSCRIFGIWFYDKDECIRIASVLEDLIKESEMNKKVADKVAMKNKRSGDNVDICTMLSKAQENYNSNKNQTLSKNAAPEESKPEMPQGVVDFFAKASGGATHFPTDKVTKPPAIYESAGLFVGHPQQRTAGVELINDTSDSQLKPLLQRLMSNPAHTVEHIEKQQRSVTPQSEATSTSKRNKAKPQSNRDGKVITSATFKARPVSSGNTTESVKSRPGNIFVAKTNTDTSTGLVENGMSFLRISSPTSSQHIAPFMGLQIGTSNSAPVDSTPDQRCLSAPLCSGVDTPQKPALMPPTMFTSSSAGKENPNKLEIGNTTPLVHNSVITSMKQELSSAASISSATVLQEEVLAIKPEPLTRNQLLQAVSYLLKHDPEFINKLHEAYVKSFTEMVM